MKTNNHFYISKLKLKAVVIHENTLNARNSKQKSVTPKTRFRKVLFPQQSRQNRKMTLISFLVINNNGLLKGIVFLNCLSECPV